LWPLPVLAVISKTFISRGYNLSLFKNHPKRLMWPPWIGDFSHTMVHLYNIIMWFCCLVKVEDHWSTRLYYCKYPLLYFKSCDLKWFSLRAFESSALNHLCVVHETLCTVMNVLMSFISRLNKKKLPTCCYWFGPIMAIS
jgi:hypothetical protein